MANSEHLAKLRQGVNAWNEWREQNPGLWVDLSGTVFESADLVGIDPHRLNLRGAILSDIVVRSSPVSKANLVGADLRETDLSDAVLKQANLMKADFRDADLTGTNLSDSDLTDANFERATLRLANLSKATMNGARLSKADLESANLKGTTLAGADLSEAKLWKVNFSHAQLALANLRWADLRDAVGVSADLGEANLNSANLRFANLSGANLSGVDLRAAHADHANLSETNLTGASLYRTGLTTADLSKATLTGADLRAATLLQANLSECIANDVMLWESQRSGWKIKDVVCKRAFWDKDAHEPTDYEAGEFERLYSDQTFIELFYQGGVTTFELNTLPGLLQHLASLHKDVKIRLKSIEETGGGARILISVGDADAATAETIRADAMPVYQAQLAMRDNDVERLRIENDILNKQNDKLINSLLAARMQHNTFNAPVYGAALSSGNSSAVVNQTVNDNAAILALLERLMERREELEISKGDATRLEFEAETAKAELQKKDPDKSMVSKSLGFIQKMATEAMMKVAGKLGEQAVSADWQSLVHQLNQFVVHLK
jgi:uncharacterized protein YjbI with pentapeptide repeats